MSQSGPSCESDDKRSTLKRKRIASNDEVENIPPLKTSKSEDLEDQPAANVVVEASSEDEEINSDPPRSVFADLDFNADSIFSPQSTTDSYPLSPLFNVVRGDSTPHSNKRASTSKPEGAPPKRSNPLPPLSWGYREKVWAAMCDVETAFLTRRSPNMFQNHPSLQPRMRAILLDWLNEVCDVYKLHRETFYLAVDYIDRYLTCMHEEEKGRLQLIGITCLFIAAKVEEVYPPKLFEFAYVTDGACTKEEILEEEILIVGKLSWDITPVTINFWLNLYLQITYERWGMTNRVLTNSEPDVVALRSYTFIYPQYSSLEFVACTQIVDLAVLHVDVNRFPYSMVAAAAMAHTFSKDIAVRSSGYTWSTLEACYSWLEPFAAELRARDVSVRGADGEHVVLADGLHLICPDINIDESHRIQTHDVTLDMFDKVYQAMTESEPVTEADSTAPSTQEEAVPHIYPPTPPQSNQKSPKTPTTKTPSTRQTERERLLETDK